jgi:5'-3' exonuclease
MNLNQPYQTIAIVDVNYLFTRNYRGAGVGASANYGATRTIEDIRGIAGDVEHCILAFDAPPYHRRTKFQAYKAHREERPSEERGQWRALKDELRRLGFRGAFSAGYEADDCIATLVTAYAVWCPDVRIVASDKDAAQLIASNVVQIVPQHGDRQAERRDREACKKKFGVYPEHMVMWQAIAGDSSDGIPGVKGLGPKKAAEVVDALVKEGLPVNFDGLAAYLGSGKGEGSAWKAIAAQWQDLALYLDLVTLDRDVPLDVEGLLEKAASAPRPAAKPMGEDYDYVGNGVNPEPELENAGGTGLELDYGDPPKRMTAEEIDAAIGNVEDVISRPKPIIGVDPGAGEFLKGFAERQVRARKADVAAAEHQTAERLAERQDLDERMRAAHERVTSQASPVGKRMLDIAERGQERRAGVKDADSCTVKHEPANEVEVKVDLPGVVEEKPEAPCVNVQRRADPRPPRAKTEADVQALVRLSAERYGMTDSNLQPLDLRATWTLANWMAESGLYKAFDTPQKVAAVILRGREMGLTAGIALAGFHVIEGKPVASADLIRSLAERDAKCKYFRLVSADMKQATWETWHTDHPGPTQFQYTIEEAKLIESFWKKDRWGKDGNWVIRPKDMLIKTAASKLARLVYPGACMGLYAVEEMGNGVIETTAEAA